MAFNNARSEVLLFAGFPIALRLSRSLPVPRSISVSSARKLVS
jgi:hypothetical protein